MNWIYEVFTLRLHLNFYLPLKLKAKDKFRPTFKQMGILRIDTPTKFATITICIM